jgi:hypothetical protein
MSSECDDYCIRIKESEVNPVCAFLKTYYMYRSHAWQIHRLDAGYDDHLHV